MQQVSKDLTQIAGAQAVALAIGVVLNVKFKAFYPQVLTHTWHIRYAIRVGLLMVPTYCGYHLVIKPRRENLNALLGHLHRRLVALGQNGNLQAYFHSWSCICARVEGRWRQWAGKILSCGELNPRLLESKSSAVPAELEPFHPHIMQSYLTLIIPHLYI